jgi:UDP-N-acetylmuramate--alanine ligase
MHYHIVGIAGAGMSAIAHLLLDQGHTVSGSDLQSNDLTAALVERGATIHEGHDAAYVEGAGAVVATAAVGDDHMELAAARAADIPLLKRPDLWREWSEQRLIIAVSGTHGKTTTTAMIAWMLECAGRNPGFLIGSTAPNLGGNARWGDPLAPLVIEADEYAGAFLALTPHIAVITNVEWDHPDIYPTEEAYNEAFSHFAVGTEGVVITCGDGGVGSWSEESRQNGVPLITYGLDTTNDYQALLPGQLPLANTDQRPSGTHARIFCVRRSKDVAYLVHDSNNLLASEPEFETGVPGVHNVRNALAAIAVADIFGLDIDVTTRALRDFRGTARRFELKGEVRGITVVDDYAHHPTEVHATLAAARTFYGPRRIIAYLQPHTYSRTRALLDQWPAVFGNADVVLIGSIYAARETDPEGEALSRLLAEHIAGRHPAVKYVGDLDQARPTTLRLLRPGDVLLTMSAGNGYLLGEAVLSHLNSEDG